MGSTLPALENVLLHENLLGRTIRKLLRQMPVPCLQLRHLDDRVPPTMTRWNPTMTRWNPAASRPGLPGPAANAIVCAGLGPRVC